MSGEVAVQRWVSNGYDVRNAFPAMHGSDKIEVRPGRGGGLYCYPPCWCAPPASRGNDKADAICLLIMVVFSAIAAFFWSVSAAKDALDHHDDYIEAKLTNSPQEMTIYRGMRNERAAAAVSRFMIAAGLAILMAALIVYCLNDYRGNPLVTNLSIAGGGTLALGVLSYGLKCVAYRYREEERAAKQIMGQA